MSDRRQFLKETAAGLAASSALGSLEPLAAGEKQGSSEEARAAIPPHRPVDLPGVHGYAEKSVAAGGTVHFRVSSTVPYQLDVCRLAGAVDDPHSDEVLHSFPAQPAKPQPMHMGSYVHVENGLPADLPRKAITLECWVRPWRLNRWQGVLTQYNYPDACGYGLFIDPQGRLQFYLGDGGAYRKEWLHAGPQIHHRRWTHVVGAWDGQTKTLWVAGRYVGSWPLAEPVRPGQAPIRLGAYGENDVADHFLDGDLAMPIIYPSALGSDDVKQRIASSLGHGDGDGAPDGTPPTETLACWPLDEEAGETIADSSGNDRHGRLINHGTWMIGGPSFNGESVGRYDADYDPEKDPRRGHGLRLASDDLYDCRWQTTHEYRLADDAKPGVYVGRIRYEHDDEPYEYAITFAATKSSDAPKAPILVLLSTSTWLAYNSAAFPAPASGNHYLGTGGLDNSLPDAPAYSMYRDHHAGQPTYYLGMNVPWPSAGPNALYSPPEVGYSHLMRGELFLHRWLDGLYGDHQGYDYDVLTDYDLHRDPGLLEGYKTVVLNGHSEYWSAEAYTGVDRYLSGGGTVVALSGNTMFWRTSFNDDGSVMECRKFDPRIGGRGGANVGELYHSHDKRRGSLMREAGYPAFQCIGLECCGWGGVDGVYHVDLPEHFLLSEPEDAGLAKDDTFGHARDQKYPMAVAHEWDVRLSTLAGITRSVPDGATLPEEPEGITTLARGKRPGGATLDYYTQDATTTDKVCAEMIYWQRPRGGRVFHAGAIGAGWALSADPKWQTVMRNVLHHFGVPATQT